MQQEQIIIDFLFKINDIVKPLPFYEKGVLIVPKKEERYQVIARAWTEGKNLLSLKIKSQIIYHVKPLHTQVKKADKTSEDNIKVVPQADERGVPFLCLYSDKDEHEVANNENPITVIK